MSSRGDRGTSPMPSRWLRILLTLCATFALTANAHAQVMPADGTGAAAGGVEAASYTTSGSYFNRELGTPLRFSYHSEGYGTDLGVVSLGSMKVFNLDGATWFLDGQGTLSDDFGGGFNVGAGYRELVNMSHGFDPDRILGASFWTDGQSTRSDNFFTQLGFGLESLGESVDFRMNGYFPLSRTKTSDPTLIDRDTLQFQENGLFAGKQLYTIDTAYSVIDAEGAKRIGNLDAWATAAVYYLGGGGADDTGYRIGVRGYAVPDLLVGVQVTDDDIYHTNVMATLTWFVGRTHKGNAPIGTIVDRFREPVMRNDFIATSSKQAETAGVQLKDADTNDFFNFIHVDSNAAAGGDGTFENPYNNLAQAEADQTDGSYVYMHGGSEFNPTADFQLVDNVKFWGEGTNQFGDIVQHQVDTVERGTVVLPETSAGAQDKLAPIINGFGLILADNNDVNNATINNATNAIVGDGVNAPQLANLAINGATGTGISFTDITGTAVVENTVTITDANQGMLIHGGNSGMNINARITNSTGSSLIVEDRTGGTIAYGGSIQDGAADTDTADAIIIRNNQDAIVNFTQVIGTSDDGPLGININSGDFNALLIDGNDEGTEIKFTDLIAIANDADTVLFNGGGTLTINNSDDESLISNIGEGNAFTHVGSAAADEGSTITVAANIDNSGGGNAVNISNHTENDITFSGEITDTGIDGSTGIVLANNTGGTIAFNDRVEITGTGTAQGVNISGGGANVTYSFSDIGIGTEDGTAFSATGDGTLVVTSAEGANDIQTGTGTAININGLAIGEGGAAFDTVNITDGAGTGIALANIDGTGVLTIGSGEDRGDGGTLSTAGTAISVNNVNNLVVSNVTVDNSAAAGAGLVVTGQNGGNAAFNQLTVTTSGAAAAVNVNGNTAGTTNFVDLEATSANGDAVVLNNNNGHTVNIEGMTATATGSGRGFAATNQGTLSVSGDTEVNSNTGIGVEIENVTIAGGGAAFGEVNVTNATTNGVRLANVGPGGLITIGSGTNPGDGGTITSAGDAILIDNADNVAITRVTIDNDAVGNSGNGLVIQNQDGGTVSVSGLTARTRDGDGIVAQNNSGGTNIFTNSNINVVGSGNGVTLDSNTGATNSFTTLAINATSGTGFSATGGGTVVATGTNTVTTTTGTGVNMDGVEIGGAGFNLNSVNVNGAVNGVTLTNITGGQYRQGLAAANGMDGTGGTLNTSGDSIILSGVTNAVFNDVRANSVNGRAALVTHTITTQSTIIFDNLATDTVATSSHGVELVDNGTGELDFTLRNSTIDAVDSNTAAFLFTAGSNSGEVDIRLQNNTELATGDNAAVSAVVNTGTGNIQFLMSGNTVTNNSGTDAAAQFGLDAGRTLNLTVGGEGGAGNSFANSGAGNGFLAETLNTTSGRINLDLRGNTSTAGNINKYQLTNVATADFGIVDRDDTINDINNTGTVNATGTFLDISSVPQPD